MQRLDAPLLLPASAGSLRESASGQTFVELALVLPLLVLILMGIIDLGRVFNAHITITNAAREGARYGSMYPSQTDEIKNRVINEATGSGINISADDIAVTFPNGTSDPGDPVRVNVAYDFPLVTWVIVGGGTIRIQSAVEMVIF